MGDRDAFGREKDENSLEGMGWSSGGGASTPPPVPQPVPRPEPARESLPGMVADVAHEGVPGTHAPPPTAFPDRPTFSSAPRRSGGGLGGLSMLFRLFRGLIPLAIIVALIAGAGGALIDTATDKATDAIESATEDLSITTETPAEPVTPGAEAEAQAPAAPKPSAPAQPPAGLKSGSLLRQQQFGAAMRKLRTGGYGRLTNLRVAPERIDATLVTKGGRLRNIQFQPGGTVRDFGTTGPGFGRTSTMSIADINSAAPSRLAASAAGRLKVPATRVNYLVYSLAFGPDARWYVYFKSGEIFAADARGRISRRIS